MFTPTILAAALVAVPSFYSYYTPEVATHIALEAAAGNYHEYLDFNGDGTLDLTDAVKVLQRRQNNIDNGCTAYFGTEEVNEIFEENGINCIYWEIDFIETEATRQYELTTQEKVNVHIYYETEIECDGFWINIDPVSELIPVL